MSAREKSTVNRIITLVTRRGGKVWKNHGGMYSGSGRPDLEGGYRGRHILIECKTATGKLSAVQRVVLREYILAGSYVCLSYGEPRTLELMLDRIDKEIDFAR